jgi:hypothetical protein
MGRIRACGWIGAQWCEKSTQQKDLRLGNKNKSIIAETFIGWLYLLTVQYWTHDNW